MDKYDFSGWATRANLKCFDGRTIMKDAFKDQDGAIVPLVWGHNHDDPFRVLGHAVLENRDGDVYAYGTFNETDQGLNAKQLVSHGDIVALSIYANGLKQDNSKNVAHGVIRELSLVLAGANPGAYIDEVLCHGEDSEDEAYIQFVDEKTNIELCHSSGDQKNEGENQVDNEAKTDPAKEDLAHADEAVAKTDSEDTTKESSGETIKDVWDTFNEKQKNVVYAIIEEAVNDAISEKEAPKDNNNESNNESNKEGENSMKHNVFDKEDATNTLSHDAMMTILEDAKRTGSLKDAVERNEQAKKALAHSVTDESGATVNYGVANLDYLFPDARNVNNVPDFITRDMAWVSKVMNGAKHLPFSRVKSRHANITMDEARAKGYTKGNQKTEEVFALLKRTTNPTTIYKKQKLDRDDIVDITDFDVVLWIKGEMRVMLNEEIARAALVGDGRLAGSDDKISEDCIRPIWKDAELYSVHKSYAPAANDTDSDKAKAFIKSVIKSRKDYKGSGNPVLYTTEDVLTDCLLIEDGNGRVIYDTADKLKTALRVSDIVTVEPMEGLTREGSGSDTNTYTLKGILVNMADYSFGADKGGAVSTFDDFDIDFNQQKYLMETRCSGALTKPYSAIVIEEAVAAE